MSVATTVAAIGAAIGAALGTVKEVGSGVIKIVVISASIFFATAFASAIISIINQLSMVVATSVVGEVFSVVSMCLPFDISVVFAGVLLAIDAILLFLVAKKTWELVSHLVGFGR